jgi:16S rRNA (adenine1518-N6/adenine1519-N6)-dimethyltransferase
MSVKDILRQNDFAFSKRFGQNFLTDVNLLRAIVDDAGVTSADTVLEIGAGAGTLTAALAERAAHVTAYEIDKRLQPILAETVGDMPNVEIIYQDFMQADTAYLRERFADAKVVANLPYYVTTPILMRLLEEGIGSSVTVTVQKEVADRLTAAPDTKDYGAITVKINLVGKATFCRPVGRNMFCPAPNVDSAVVRIDRVPDQYDDRYPALSARIARAAFAMRRKTLVNNLTATLGITRDEAERALAAVGLPIAVRGEVLSAAQFVALAAALAEQGVCTQ